MPAPMATQRETYAKRESVGIQLPQVRNSVFECATPARRIASVSTVAPSSWGSNDERPPQYDPTALRAADNTTTSFEIVSLHSNPIHVHLYEN